MVRPREWLSLSHVPPPRDKRDMHQHQQRSGARISIQFELQFGNITALQNFTAKPFL